MKRDHASIRITFRFVAPLARAGRGLKRGAAMARASARFVAPLARAGRGLKRLGRWITPTFVVSPRSQERGAD